MSPVGFTSDDSLLEEIVREDLADMEMAAVRFLRAMYWRHSPHPRLAGPRLSRWIARRLGVYATNVWVKDPDWEPQEIRWVEDELMPRGDQP